MRALPDPTRRQRFRPTCTVSEKSVKRGGGLVSGVPAVVSGPATLAPKDEPDGRLGLETNEVRVSAASPGECCASCAARLGACWTTKKRPAEATLDGAGWMCGSAAEGSNNGRRASSCASGTVATPQGVAIGSAEVLQVQTSMWCVVVASRNCPSGENATLQRQRDKVMIHRQQYNGDSREQRELRRTRGVPGAASGRCERFSEPESVPHGRARDRFAGRRQPIQPPFPLCTQHQGRLATLGVAMHWRPQNRRVKGVECSELTEENLRVRFKR